MMFPSFSFKKEEKKGKKKNFLNEKGGLELESLVNNAESLGKLIIYGSAAEGEKILPIGRREFLISTFFF